MPTYPNGRVPVGALTELSHGFLLLNSVANAYRGWHAASRLHGVRIDPVDSYGSGYRSLAVQKVFWEAGQGNRVAAAMANLDPDLKVNIAVPGYSSHGTGTRADVLFNHHSPDASNIALAKKYGFTREFGNDDTNHFRHDLKTAINGYRTDDLVRIVCTELNGRNLGKSSNANIDGDRGPNDGTSHYRWMVQKAGKLDGIYKGTVDGIFGPLSEATEMRYYLRLRDAS